MYDDPEYAAERLIETYIRYDGKPVLVRDVQSGDGEIKLDLYNYGNGMHDLRDISDPKFNFHPIPLGYVNSDGYAYYLQRMPERRWKQGIDHRSVECKNQIGPARRHVLLQMPLYNSIVNPFPSYEQVLEEIRADAVKSRAFHKKFALMREGLGNKVMRYKERTIGWLEDDRILLSKDYIYLKEMLEVEGVKYNVG